MNSPSFQTYLVGIVTLVVSVLTINFWNPQDLEASPQLRNLPITDGAAAAAAAAVLTTTSSQSKTTSSGTITTSTSTTTATVAVAAAARTTTPTTTTTTTTNTTTATSTSQQDTQTMTPAASMEYWKGMWSRIKLPQVEENSLIDLSIHNDPKKSSNFSFGEFMSSFPISTDSGTIQIYNNESYRELIHAIMTKQTNFTICGMGGSSTAGGGNIGLENVFDAKFKNYLDTFLRSYVTDAPTLMLFENRSLNLINRGHGTRHSLHSAVLAPYFFPPEMDLLFWEFSINDFGYWIQNNRREEQERSIMIDWLLEVERIKPTPKVILVYLWRTPAFSGDRVNDGVFESHWGLSKRFEFIVGHVNVVSYVRESYFTPERRKSLVIDRHHPSVAGHAAITFLIFYLLSGEPLTTSTVGRDTDNDRIDPTSSEVVNAADRWFCGNETEDKRLIMSLLIEGEAGNNDTFARHTTTPTPQRVFTLERPQNADVDVEKKLILVGNQTLHVLGRQSSERVDRQMAKSISCCRANNSSSASLSYTKFEVPDGSQKIDSLHAIFFGFPYRHNDYTNLILFANGKRVVNGRLIRGINDWPCFWSWKDIYSPAWYYLDMPALNVSNLQFCMESTACTETASETSPTLLISLLLY